MTHGCYGGPVRTTVTIGIDDDVLAVAKALATRRGSSLSSVVSELARRGLQASTPAQKREGETVFTVAADAKAITSEDVHRSLDDWPTNDLLILPRRGKLTKTRPKARLRGEGGMADIVRENRR